MDAQGRVSLSFSAEKVQSQLEQLTLEEKISLLSGSGFATTVSVPRLDIPSLNLAEGVNGVKDAGAIDSGDTVADVLAGGGPKTVSFPSTSCFGATWNVGLMERLGEALGSQARDMNVATIMGPGVNLHRDPRCGRNFEYFSEDPYLTGRLSGSMINGIQRQGVGACAKHFVANDAENYRKAYNVTDRIGGRALRELYLAAFQELLVLSNPVAIMTSYNKVNNVYTCETPLLANVIRGEWKYDGSIMSDWFGTVSTVPSILAGQDLEMPGPTIFRGPRLVQAVKDGLVSEEIIDQRARKMLEWIDKVTAPKLAVALTQNESAAVARQVASEGVVLLKNQDNLLPLDLKEPKKVAVIGVPAADPPLGGGGSSLAPPQYVRTPLEYIKSTLKNEGLVRHARGVGYDKIMPLMPANLIVTEPGQPGVQVIYRNNSSGSIVVSDKQKIPQVMMLGRVKPELDEANGFTYEMGATFLPDVTGRHNIGVRSTGAYTLFIDDVEVLSSPSPDCTAVDFLFTPSKLERSTVYPMVSGQSYRIRLLVHSWKSMQDKPSGPSPHIAELCFRPETNDDLAIEEAVLAAKESDVSIVFAGRNSQHEAEGSDMEDLFLPGNQTALINAVAAASKKTIVVLHSGAPLDVSQFVDSVDGIIYANYLGQEGGAVIADILYGKVNPSGKLPTSWPQRLEDTPTFKIFPAVKDADGKIELILEEGVNVGYKHNWDVGSLRYAFGFGLSYTKFQLSDLSVEPSQVDVVDENTIATITVKLSNIGAVAGAEVVQVYVSPIGPSHNTVKALKGFSKTFLDAGASQVQKISLDLRRALSYWDAEAQLWRVDKKVYSVHIEGFEGSAATITVHNDIKWLGL